MHIARMLRRAGIAGIAIAVLLAPVGEAAARRFQMDGAWLMRRGRIFWPLQFGWTELTGMTFHTTTGSMALGFPNGPVPGVGSVTATGSAPATLRVPPQRFGGDFGTVLPFQILFLIQITTMLAADGPAATASLAPSAGPGSFTWCPGDPACAPTGPPQGAGSRNGRIVYRAGANRFGGVIQMLLSGGGVASELYQSSPLQARHVLFGPQPGPRLQHTGGPYGFTNVYTPPSGFVTQPTYFSRLNGLITRPGPKRTTMGGLTDTGTGPTLLFPGQPTSNTGFPATTGTVIAQQTAGTSGADFFTLMGSDVRTPLGAGNIHLVSGGLSLRRGLYRHTFSASFGSIRMTLSPPVPALSPAGLAAAAALVLLAAGYALSRRR